MAIGTDTLRKLHLGQAKNPLRLNLKINTWQTTSPSLFLERIRRRDASVHVDVSDSQVEQINAAVLRKKFTFDAQIDNNRAGPGDIIRQFKAMIND